MLAPMGLRLSEEKTTIVHIDEGFDFLGFHIQRRQQWGSDRRFIYTMPSKKAFASIKAKVKEITRYGTNNPLSDLLRQLNSALRGWTTYFRHGASTKTFGYLEPLHVVQGLPLAASQVPSCHQEAVAKTPFRSRVAA